MKFHLSSNAFQDNQLIPSQYTCDGENISPQLQWEGAPANTKSFALIVDDPDAPSKTWVHWVLFNIPAETTAIDEGATPRSAVVGVNDFGHVEYGGPCPPSGTHRYFFKLYALDQMLPLASGVTKQQVENAMKSHVLAEAQFIGRYSRE